MTARVLLVEDHTMLRQGLRALLERHPDLEVVGEAADGHEAVALCREHRPDVVIMDVVLPGRNGIEATRQIVAEAPTARVIALSMHADRRYVREMLRAGAVGFVLKDSASDEVMAAIWQVLAGRRFLGSGVADLVIDDYLQTVDRAVSSSAFSVLSDREREVLQLIAEGVPTREIAARLGVSVKTVESHRRQIMDKLGLHTVAELTKYALREELTSL